MYVFVAEANKNLSTKKATFDGKTINQPRFNRLAIKRADYTYWLVN